MSVIKDELDSLRQLDELARKGTFIHRLNPLVKLITTVTYLAVVISFDKYEILSLFPYLLYPILVAVLSDIPVGLLRRRILLAEPFLIGVSLLNLFFDRQVIWFGQVAVAGGWIAMGSLALKGTLTVMASLLLIATAGLDGTAAALRRLRIPRLLVWQLLLTYRYIAVLLEEVDRVLTAYALRAPGSRGIRLGHMGSIVGQLLLRTMDRAQRVYQAMCLRGFTGEYQAGGYPAMQPIDWLYLTGWLLYFTIMKLNNLPELLGELLAGGIR